MRIDIATLFPGMCEAVLSESIIGRARKAGLIEIYCHQIRDYTNDKHRRVDDTPYGGGMGMVLQAQPVYSCFSEVSKNLPQKPHVIYMSPKGDKLTQKKAAELAKLPFVFFICGHYEGIDQRVIDKIADEELSIGDYVITGGELACLVTVDAVARMIEGVLPSPECFEEESHFNGLLEYPHYTRPEIWEGVRVPADLLGGHHANIEKYRREEALMITAERRPDMIDESMEEIKKIPKSEYSALERIAEEYLPDIELMGLKDMFRRSGKGFAGLYISGVLVGFCFGHAQNREEFILDGTAVKNPFNTKERMKRLLDYFEKNVMDMGFARLIR